MDIHDMLTVKEVAKSDEYWANTWVLPYIDQRMCRGRPVCLPLGVSGPPIDSIGDSRGARCWAYMSKLRHLNHSKGF